VDVIPNAAVTLEYVSQTADAEDSGSTTETSQSGLVSVGLGLVYRDRLSVQPVAHIPFATDVDEKASFGVFASVILPLPVPGFGR
jgi:hypothetical protein